MKYTHFGIPTSTIFVAEIREPPDVGQVDGETDDRQQKVHFLTPGLALVGGGERHLALGAS